MQTICTKLKRMEIHINKDTNQTIKHNNQTKTKLSPQGR